MTPLRQESDINLDAFRETIDSVVTRVEQLQAQAGRLTPGEAGQILYDNFPMLPRIDSAEIVELFSYMKYFLDFSNAQAIFGPFAPIVNHIKIALLLALAWFAIYFGYKFIVPLLMFLFKLLFGLIRFIGHVGINIIFHVIERMTGPMGYIFTSSMRSTWRIYGILGSLIRGGRN